MEFGNFYVVVLQRTAKKCIKIYNAHAQPFEVVLSAFDLKHIFCLFERPFKVAEGMAFFLFEISFFVLEILTFFYYAN